MPTISTSPLIPLTPLTPVHGFDPDGINYQDAYDPAASPVIPSVDEPLLGADSKPNWEDFESPNPGLQYSSTFSSHNPLHFDSEDSNSEPSPHEMKSLLFKLDIIILPLALLLYLSAYLDRGNLGNAKLQGMQDDVLGGSSKKYARALSCFYITVSIGW